MDRNHVILMGRVGQTADVKQVNGTSVANFTLATNRSVPDGNDEKGKQKWKSL
jgi:single-stranded DNA-binding protein